MTGHDLDLDAIKADLTVRERISGTESYAENLAVIHGERSGTTIGDADRRVLTIHAPALVAEVESLRVKLAAAEQERDHARAEWHRHNERADHERFLRSRQSEELRRAETALAAVRKAIRAERDRFAQATNWKFVAHVKPAVDRIDAAVAAAEQPEPTPEQP